MPKPSKQFVRHFSPRTSMFQSLRRLFTIARLANEKGNPPADELIERPRRPAVSRREFLQSSSCGLVAGALSVAWPARAKAGFKAVLFDAFPIFDPSPLATLSRELFGQRGDELTRLWRNRQFEYTWLRISGQRYADFWKVTEDALVFAANVLKLDLPAAKRQALMKGYLRLEAWPDVKPTLSTLRLGGLRLGFLSNFTETMLSAAIQNSGLEGMFDVVLSTDRVHSYKPDPRAYQMGMDALQLHRDEILFVPFAGWDAAGAKSFGYETCWANRLNLPVEELGVEPNTQPARDCVAATITRRLLPCSPDHSRRLPAMVDRACSRHLEQMAINACRYDPYCFQ